MRHHTATIALGTTEIDRAHSISRDEAMRICIRCYDPFQALEPVAREAVARILKRHE